MRRNNIFLSGLFLTIIGLPIILGIFDVDFNLNINENRRLAEFPKFEFEEKWKDKNFCGRIASISKGIMNYKNDYELYHEDNFKLKPVLFKSYYFIKSNIFLINPMPDKVVKGKNEWFFLGDSHSHAIKESKGIKSFNHKSMETIIDNVYHRKTWLEERNISYILAVAPNKHTIYGDYLPIKKHHGNTNFEKLKASRLTNLVSFVDLGKDFENQANSDLYYKRDSHWNDLGAYYGYLNLMNAVEDFFEDIYIVPLSEFDTVASIANYDDLNLPGIFKDQKSISFEKKKVSTVKIENRLNVPNDYTGPFGSYESRFFNCKNDLKVVVTGDSFSTALIQFIKESFGCSVFIRDRKFNKELFESEQPDLVINEIVERSIETLWVK